jgi:anaerobic selenocysteine-containing dehydrogenase
MPPCQEDACNPLRVLRGEVHTPSLRTETIAILVRCPCNEEKGVPMAIQQMHTYCAMCVSRCGVVATVEDGFLKQVRADPEHPNGCRCVKGAAAPEIVYSSDLR